ncbi:ATP-binding protein [Bacteroides pyogenes]|uniref:ATP-dependent nuclease n=1 Tax=Bacteroides pyogenes TaxID=310300 RepID=UPI002FDA49A6
MSHITNITIKNYRGIKELTHDFGSEKFIVLIGRGDSGKSTILSAIYAVLSPAWNMTFSDLDFHNQDTTHPIEISLTIKELPIELLKESKYGLYIQNDLNQNTTSDELSIIIMLTVDETLEPHWAVKARIDSDIDDKPISGSDRALLAANFITDYTDNQFAYNRQSPLYTLTKTKLEDKNTIEHVKSELIRSMTTSVKAEQIQPLNAPLEDLKKTAEKLGLNIIDLCAQIDIKENPYTGNSIALHSESLPYRLRGKGSKRLMSIAIQFELTKQGGIVMVDELEQGLEPDRIITLIRILKETTTGQVFITTHSLNVVLEAECNNLFVVNKGAKFLNILDEKLNACRRSNPQALFAKKIICCEGKTELGFIRAIDDWIQKKYHTTLSAKGVVIVNAAGGSNMFTYAKLLKDLGYDTCVFADDDKPNELKTEKKKSEEAGIKLFLCESGNCLERQIIMDLPWNSVFDIIKCSQEGFPYSNILLSNDFISRMSHTTELQKQKEIRNEIIELSIKKKYEWFKHIPGGEFLGSTIIKAYDELDDNCRMKQNVKSLLKWCNIEND